MIFAIENVHEASRIHYSADWHGDRGPSCCDRPTRVQDLPRRDTLQESTKIELIINLKAAKALGLMVPLTLQGRADEMIE